MQDTVAHHSDPVTNGESLVGVMGDDHPAGVASLQHRRQFAAEMQTDFNIQAGKGLIQENNPWGRCKSPCQGETLPLPPDN